MAYKQKRFAERFNKELDALGMPEHQQERLGLVVKMFHIQRHKAHAFLNGDSLPDPALLEYIAGVFEVNPEWLAGNDVARHLPSPNV